MSLLYSLLLHLLVVPGAALPGAGAGVPVPTSSAAAALTGAPSGSAVALSEFSALPPAAGAVPPGSAVARSSPAPAQAPAPRGGAELTIAQLQYGGGGDWYSNPSGLPNLLRAIRQRTKLPVADRPGRVQLTDAALWNYPYLYMTGHGNVRFTEEEVGILRRYLLSGGFLHVDDNYGLDESFRREIRRVFPDKELVELPVSHPVYHGFYEFPRGLPKIHQHDGKPAQGFGIMHEGRLILFYSYESDLGNGWEDPDTYGDPPELREAALRMGVNLFLHALSQVVS